MGRDQPTGLAAYVVVEALASDVLALGQTVIVDAVNEPRRRGSSWRGLARRRGVALRYIEVVCPDRALHRRRLEARQRDIDGSAEPTWASVEARRANFDVWREERLILDSTASLAGNARVAMAHLGDAR
ncbi:AAA family ATPase [Streptosporangium sp. NPDC003464]